MYFKGLILVLLMASTQGKNNGLLKKIYKSLKLPKDSTYLQDIVHIADNKDDITSMQANISANAIVANHITGMKANIAANVADIDNIETNNAIVANHITGMKTNISANVADIDNIETNNAIVTNHITGMKANIAANSGSITTNNGIIGTNTNEIATNTANIATHDAGIATNVANIASNAVAITNIDAQIENLQPTGIFENCVNEWCLQNGLTYPQYTKCESTEDNGQTCIKPGIRYGNVYGPGRPLVNSGNDYDQWCQSLGGSNYVKHSEEYAGYPANSCVFGCTGYDEVSWHWCDCQNGYWYNESLDSTSSNFNSVVSITCSRNTGDIITSMQADVATHDADIATNAANTNTNTNEIATNTANIANNSVAITNLEDLHPYDIYRQKCAVNETNYRMINNKCVYYEISTYNYEDAKQKCEARFNNNGRLFEPKTWNENEVAYKVGKALDTKTWRIGINDKQNEGQFVFESDGTPISYSPKWYSGHGAQGTTKNCILFAIFAAEWHDHICSYVYSSICEQIA